MRPGNGVAKVKKFNIEHPGTQVSVTKQKVRVKSNGWSSLGTGIEVHVNESVPVSICVQTASAVGLRSYGKRLKKNVKNAWQN